MPDLVGTYNKAAVSFEYSFSDQIQRVWQIYPWSQCVYKGDYDYCQVPGTRQLCPLEVGEDNSKFEPKKIKINQYGNTQNSYRGFQAY